MYRDHDRRVLEEIEEQLRLHDPGFLERMRAAPPHPRPSPASLVVCALLYTATPIAMLLFGWPGAVIAALLVTVITVSVVIHRRLRSRASRGW